MKSDKLEIRTKNIFTFILGIAFGLALSLGGATTYDFHASFFLFKDFQILQLIVAAILFASFMFWILKKLAIDRCLIFSNNLDYSTKPYTQYLILGSCLFGVGWALSGSCPGTAPVMLTEGNLAAIFVIIGIFAGTWLAGKLGVNT